MGLAIALGLMTMPEQPPMPEAATAFMTGIMATGYFFPLLKTTEALCGLLLLINRAAPAALVILAPITLNIILFHIFLTPGINNLFMPVFMGVCHLAAMCKYSDLYNPLFGKK